MENLPPEVLQIICSNLSFRDAAAARFLTRKLSTVAAEFLVTRVRFHTSQDSLDRLEKISNHETFSRTVKVIIYEAALLADVNCRRDYARHFEHDHWGLEKPREPPMHCSLREKRLFRRNKRKWTRDIDDRYDAYRALFHAQELLLDHKVVESTLSRCIPRFSKLTYIDIDPVRRCSHLTSQRFIEEFGSDCISPLSGNFTKIGDQLKWLLLPQDTIIKSLRKLEVNSVSPSFFTLDRKDLLQTAFASLTDVDIVLKLMDGDAKSGEHPNQSFQRHLSNGVLRDTLAAASSLENLSIGVDSGLPFFVQASQLVPSIVWPQLKSISLSAVTSSQSEFLSMLKQQPSLRTVHATLVRLDPGSWPDTLTAMRDELKLHTFLPIGMLEDTQDAWPMDLINVPIYIDSHEECDLSNMIDIYVTDNGSFIEADGRMPNPLSDGYGDFEEGEVVRDMYGSFSDEDSIMSLDDSEEPMDSNVSMDDSDYY